MHLPGSLPLYDHSLDDLGELPTHFDWRSYNTVTPVKNQGKTQNNDTYTHLSKKTLNVYKISFLIQIILGKIFITYGIAVILTVKILQIFIL